MQPIKKILITGGSGFVGNVLIKKLLKSSNYPLLLLENKRLFTNDIRNHPKVHIISADLEQLNNQARLKIELKNCSHLIHLAGFVSRDPKQKQKLFQIHVTASQALLSLIEASSVERILLLSTSGTVGITDSPSKIPDDDSEYAVEYAFRFPYYASKILQEKIFHDFAKKTKRTVIALRPSLILGAGDKQISSVDDVLQILHKKRPFKPRGGLSVVDVEDVAIAIEQALHRPNLAQPGFRSFLLGAENLQFSKFIELIEKAAGQSNTHFAIPPLLKHGLIQIINYSPTLQKKWNIHGIELEMADLFWYIDSSRAKNEFNITFRCASEVIFKTVHDLKQRGLI